MSYWDDLSVTQLYIYIFISYCINTTKYWLRAIFEENELASLIWKVRELKFLDCLENEAVKYDLMLNGTFSD